MQFLFLSAVKRDVSETPQTVQSVYAVWGGLGGGNTRPSCCRSLLTSSVSILGESETACSYKQSKRSMEKSSDLKDEPALPLRRCERSRGPDHVLVKSLCPQTNFQDYLGARSRKRVRKGCSL